MAHYDYLSIETKWQQFWEDNQTFKADVDPSRPKFYALDMFPYPSGAGLHVGHPLGYIASDIVSRYKRLCGFNVLHPMGFDSFGLPAEQYAVQTGQHPAVTTAKNIDRYKDQLRKIGFSFDWSKEVQTSDPKYYHWTQWIFCKLFDSWYDKKADKAAPIDALISFFAKNGNQSVNAVCDEDTEIFTANDWTAMSADDQERMLLRYRLAFLAETSVNWCPGLGTVLANEEVKDGFSERGNFPVVRKSMQQWSLRITAYADRLLKGLDEIDWSEPVKEMQRNWIGRSKGAWLNFNVDGHDAHQIKCFTTRIDTIYGVTFLVLAPEHELVAQITTAEQKDEIENYVDQASRKSERERMMEVKVVSGAFTGAYAVNPLKGDKIPVYIADYVLAGYGTGAIMAVPSGDQRDWNFATHFGLPKYDFLEGMDSSEAANPTKKGILCNSGLLDGMSVKDATYAAVVKLKELGMGDATITYRMRDAIFSRQRYWGEPLPVYFENGLPKLLDESELPLELPKIDAYKPTEDGAPPLGRAKDWTGPNGAPYELSTMPGWAGSSAYAFRYMDAGNPDQLIDPEKQTYWESVDLYIGGTEHATGHLLYSRFWTKFLYDIGKINVEEPFKKLVNQGMIQGRSNLMYRVKGTDQYVSLGLKDDHETTPYHVDVNIVKNDILDIEAFKAWSPNHANATFILEDDQYVCGWQVEKMSKRLYNVVNPDDIVAEHGGDTLRMYEMFLGPLEQSKPWNTNGIDGVSKFLRKFWRLFHTDETFALSDEAATKAELKVLHATIKKVQEDIERLSFNTSVSAFMVCVNELNSLKCNKRAILEPLVITLSPFAPHICEELWSLLGHDESISFAKYPEFDPAYLVEDSFEYPIMINGKLRTKLSFATDMSKEDIEKEVLTNEIVQKWLEGKAPKRMVVVPKKIVNVVI